MDFLSRLKDGFPFTYRYVSALLIVGVAILLRIWLDPVLNRTGFAIFLTGMLVAAWVGGIGPALISQTAILLAEAWWFAPPGKPTGLSAQGVVSLLAFYSVGLVVASLSEACAAGRKRELVQKREAINQREQLRATFACIGDGAIVTDNSGNVKLMNVVAETMTGRLFEECANQPIQNVFVAEREDSPANVQVALERVLVSGEIRHEEFGWVLMAKSGTSLPIAFSIAPIFDESGEVMGAVLTFSDQTERRQMMNELREANRRKDEFLATLAHELRNPLAPISMGVELLQMSLDDRDTVEEIVDTMGRQSKHMVRLIDDLLDVSRITRGKVELRKSQVAISQVIKDAIEAVRPLVEEVAHRLVVSMPENSIEVFADPNRLTQIVSNLLNNACKYTPPGGLIELTVKRLDGHVEIIVADNGLGIPLEQQEQIFDLFTQAHTAKENGHKGLGIGLTLVKRLVEMHQGTVVIESGGKNHGTLFRVTIPALPAVQSVQEPVIPSSKYQENGSPAKQARVLVVDDNLDALKTIGILVKRLGHEVREAHDGIEAVATAQQFRPEIILMDIGMPRLNGYDAAKRIRQQAWGTKTTLIATTGWGQDEHRRRTREAGFDHHLVKPVNPIELKELLCKLLPCQQVGTVSSQKKARMQADA